MNTLKDLLSLILILFLCIGCQGFSWKISKPYRKISLTAQKYQVIIEHEGNEHQLQVSSNYNILDAALDAGLQLSHDCKLGVCLTCPAKLVSGTVDQSEGTLEESVKSQGYVLMCIAKPQSDVRIQTIPEDELISEQFKRDN